MLKKLIYGLALVGAMTACSDDYDDWGIPQANEPEEAQNVTLTVANVDPIDMAQVEGDSVAVFVPTLTAEEGTAVSYKVSVSNEEKNQTEDLVADEQGRVAVADLTNTVVNFYGKRPSQRQLFASVAVYVNRNGQVVKKTAAEELDIKVTLVAPVIENAYYLVGDGIGWDYAGAIGHKLNHSGKDVYDDPVFSIIVPAPKKDNGERLDFNFKLVPESAIATGDLVWDGVLGSDVEDGDLRPEAGIAVGGGAFRQLAGDGASMYKITVNMMDYKMKVEPLKYESTYYLVGDGIGWDYAGAMKTQFKHVGANLFEDPVFSVTVPAPMNDDGTRKDFYFKVVPGSCLSTGDLVWDGVLGSDVADGDDRPEAGLAAGGGAFCQHAADGAMFYKIKIDMIQFKMTVEPLAFQEWIYMPGNPQGWNPGTAPGLRSANFDGVYVGYGRLDGEFKFTKGHEWSDGEYNFGSFSTYGEGFSAGGGSNIKFDGEAGYYKIVADVANGALTATLTNWGIIGPAQPGGWDKDTDMTYNAGEDCWEATLDLNADELKFRANDGWDINFGGDVNNLTEGGNNIKVAEAGNYTVKLFISCSNGKTNRYCTLTKN